MTRGRERNVAHLVAGAVDDARRQWIDVFGRDREIARRLRPFHISGDVELKVHSVVEHPADREALAFATAHEEEAWATSIAPSRTATALCKVPGEYAIAKFGVGREADVA